MSVVDPRRCRNNVHLTFALVSAATVWGSKHYGRKVFTANQIPARHSVQALTDNVTSYYINCERFSTLACSTNRAKMQRNCCIPRNENQWLKLLWMRIDVKQIETSVEKNTCVTFVVTISPRCVHLVALGSSRALMEMQLLLSLTDSVAWVAVAVNLRGCCDVHLRATDVCNVQCAALDRHAIVPNLWNGWYRSKYEQRVSRPKRAEQPSKAYLLSSVLLHSFLNNQRFGKYYPNTPCKKVALATEIQSLFKNRILEVLFAGSAFQHRCNQLSFQQSFGLGNQRYYLAVFNRNDNAADATNCRFSRQVLNKSYLYCPSRSNIIQEPLRIATQPAVAKTHPWLAREEAWALWKRRFCVSG